MRIYPSGNNKLMKDKSIVATIQEYLNTQVNRGGGGGGQVTHRVEVWRRWYQPIWQGLVK